MSRRRSKTLEVGRRIPADRLLQQTEYFLGLLDEELPRLRPFGVDTATVARAVALREGLSERMGGRAAERSESESARVAQDRAIAECKRWLRRASLIGQMAFEGNPRRAADFVGGPQIGLSVPRVAGRMSRLLGLLRHGAKQAARFGADEAFLREGRRLRALLDQADAKQETGRANLVTGTAEFHRAKAELCALLRRISRAGHAAYVDDPVNARRYRLTILHRRGAAASSGAER
ncbi:MAG: hypothetical protein HYY17_09130 [Planctomycetes bacterium]|nr:hypothetical protein [Planctomycetota bacterium]